MIILQMISVLVLIILVVLCYTAALKLVNEHRKLQNILNEESNQDNLDLKHKQ